MRLKLLSVFIVPSLILCATPGQFMSTIWPQKSIPLQEYGNPKAAKRVLIGGVTSPFKEAIIKSIIDSLSRDSVYVKTIRLKALKKEKTDDWNAILIVNTCMAWDMNYKAKKYVKSYSDYKSFVVVTTAAEADSCGSPKKYPKNIDAVTTASEDQKISEVVSKTLQLLSRKIE